MGNAAWDQTLSFYLTHHYGHVPIIIELVFGYWLCIWILFMGFVDLGGGLPNFDSYRLKQTLKEQSWWSNQYLLHFPHLSKASSLEVQMLLTFSNGK